MTHSAPLFDKPKLNIWFLMKAKIKTTMSAEGFEKENWVKI